MKNNWQNKVKSSYNTKPKEFVKNPEEKRKVLSGKSIDVWRDDVNGALKKLKKVLEADNRQKDLARTEYYEKPSVKRKRKKDVAKSRWQRDINTMRSAGTWVDTVSSGTKCLKTSKTRRKHVELVDKIKNRAKPKAKPKFKRK